MTATFRSQRTSPERAVVGPRLTACGPFGSLRAVSVSCRYSAIRTYVAEVLAASCWGLSTKPPVGDGLPEFAALQPGGSIPIGFTRLSDQVESTYPPVTAKCFGKKTSCDAGLSTFTR